MKELVGTAEAAELIGMKKQNFVSRVASRKDFPKPVAELKMGRIWQKKDVLEWKRKVTHDQESLG